MRLFHLVAPNTRPDISSAVSSLSRFNGDLGQAHWEDVQHVLRYLSGTARKGICYTAGSSTKIWGYCDSSHLTCLDTSRSRAGYVFLSAEGAISWKSKLVEIASLSSCESEYMALAAEEARFLRQLQSKMQGPGAIPSPICIHINN